MPPSSNAVVVSVSPGLAIGGGAAGVCATADMADISAEISMSFFIVPPRLPAAAIENAPNLTLLAVSDVNGAIRGLSYAVGAGHRVGRTHERLLAREAAGKDLGLARRLAAGEGL